MTPIETLIARIDRETLVYRKGPEITVRDVGPVRVVEVFGYPEAPSYGELVDVYFVSVGFTEAAADPAGFRADVEAACVDPGYNGVMLTVVDLAGGPSYITLGGWLGSQELALRFMALAAHYGCSSEPITPARFGADADQAAELAGRGFVMLGGWRAA